MKKLFLYTLISIFCIEITAQSNVYNSANFDIVDKSFIDSFYNEKWEGIEPFVHKKDTTVYSNNKQEQYNISLYKFKGWENEPGDFNVIKISSKLQSNYIQTDGNGWSFFYTNEEEYHIYGPIYTIEMDNGCTFILFTGITIDVDLPILTVYALKDGKVTLVFNKQTFINSITTKNGVTDFTLQLNALEFDKDPTTPVNPADIHHLKFESGRISYQ